MTNAQDQEPSAGATPPPPAEQAAGEAPVRVAGLSKYYGNFTAIEDVSFEVPHGSITAFLGPNGAGKSTTMKVLTGFLAPSSGSAWINGHDMASDRLAGSVGLGYLPENGPLYHDMTPAAFLRFIAETRGLDEVAVDAALSRVAEQCMIKEVWQKSIKKLSKGFRQRVGLAQAILHDPSVLVLDEPTSGLDPNQILTVRDLIRDLAKTKTILMSTHILQEVDAVADRVVLINEGRVVFQGTPVELAGQDGLETRFHALTKGGTA